MNPDGTAKWTFGTLYDIPFSTPAIGADGSIYIGTRDWNSYAVNPDGTGKWTFKTGDEIWSSAAIGGDGMITLEARTLNFMR